MEIKSITFGAGDAVVIEIGRSAADWHEGDPRERRVISTTVAYLQGPPRPDPVTGAVRHATVAAEYSERHGVDIGPAVETAYQARKAGGQS